MLSTYSAGVAFGVVLHSLHDAGLDIPVFASQGNLSYVEMKQYAENLPSALFLYSVRSRPKASPSKPAR